VIISPSLILSWCYNKRSKNIEVDQVKIDYDFSKKQECIKYQEWLEQKITEKIKSYELSDDLYYESIREIFYSPVKNSCIALTRSNEVLINKKNETLQQEYYKIYDLLSADVTNYDVKNPELMQMYTNEINILKWER
jgi:hypothetical protein